MAHTTVTRPVLTLEVASPVAVPQATHLTRTERHAMVCASHDTQYSEYVKF